MKLGYSKRLEKLQLAGKETICLDYEEYKELVRLSRMMTGLLEDIDYKEEVQHMLEVRGCEYIS